LVLVIHGGPRAASLETFSAQAQLIAARGWLVFQPNYRGSDQLGTAYQRAIRNDAGDGPGRDVMAGVAAVKKRGFVDEARVTVSQGYNLFHALKDNGVDTKFIAYPIPGHSAADPVRQRDVQRRWLEWIEQHFVERTSSQ